MDDEYIIFTGRPNAGKSTAIRALTGLKVPIGKKPGTTTKINTYRVGKSIILVDMPGYGRKVGAPREWEDRVKNSILDFIEKNATYIAAAVHVLNISTFLEVESRLAKKGFISLDVEMIEYIQKVTGNSPLVAANKIDKGNEAEIISNVEALIDRINFEDGVDANNYVYPVSLKNKVGIGQLKDALAKQLASRGHRKPFELIHG